MSTRPLPASKFSKFFSLPLSEQVLFLQAWFLLGWARGVILCRPFRRVVRQLQHSPEAIENLPVTPQQLHSAQRIGYLVSAAASCTPWQSLCLVQALVAQRLLSARGIPGQFVLGVCKDQGMSSENFELAAHAWLVCGNEVVVGDAGHDQYRIVSSYSWGSE